MVDTRLNWSYRYEGYYNSNIVQIEAFMRLCINDKTDIVAVVNAGSGQWEGLKCCWKVSLVIAGWIIMFVCSEQEWICFELSSSHDINTENLYTEFSLCNFLYKHQSQGELMKLSRISGQHEHCHHTQSNACLESVHVHLNKCAVVGQDLGDSIMGGAMSALDQHGLR